MLRKSKTIVIYFCLFFYSSQLFFHTAYCQEIQVIQGVFLKGYQLGKKNRTEVFSILQEEESLLKKQSIVLQIPDCTEEIKTSYGELGIEIDKERIWKEASEVGRTGRWWERIWTKWQVKKRGREIPLRLKINKNLALLKIKNYSHPWYIEPQEAKFVIKSNDKIEIISHILGQDVDGEAALSALDMNIHENPGKEIHLQLSFLPIKPAKLQSDLESYHITGVISEFTTQFNFQKLNRTTNIKLAAHALDYYLIAPGNIFSFNQVVGPRTKESGYNEANIIWQNEFVPGIGGGVCQVSTTLYNSVLRAELEIIERYPHSMVIPYVKPGLDATVVYDIKDFKFRNNTSGYLILKSWIYQGNLTIKIFGKAERKRKVVIRSRVEKEIPPKTIYRDDPNISKGQYILEREGEPGRIIKVERLIYDEKGKLLRTDYISRDYYPPIDQLIITFFGSPLLSNL